MTTLLLLHALHSSAVRGTAGEPSGTTAGLQDHALSWQLWKQNPSMLTAEARTPLGSSPSIDPSINMMNMLTLGVAPSAGAPTCIRLQHLLHQEVHRLLDDLLLVRLLYPAVDEEAAHRDILCQQVHVVDLQPARSTSQTVAAACPTVECYYCKPPSAGLRCMYTLCLSSGAGHASGAL